MKKNLCYTETELHHKDCEAELGQSGSTPNFLTTLSRNNQSEETTLPK